MHIFFPLLAVVCLGLSASDRGFVRGPGPLLILVSAVVVREIARLLVAAYWISSCAPCLLLPIGGLFAYANPESQEAATRASASSPWRSPGPLANCVTALMLAAAFIGAGGDVTCLPARSITSDHLVRSMVWMQAGLGVLHLLPAYPLDFGRLLRGNFARAHGTRSRGTRRHRASAS